MVCNLFFMALSFPMGISWTVLSIMVVKPLLVVDVPLWLSPLPVVSVLYDARVVMSLAAAAATAWFVVRWGYARLADHKSHIFAIGIGLTDWTGWTSGILSDVCLSILIPRKVSQRKVAVVMLKCCRLCRTTFWAVKSPSIVFLLFLLSGLLWQLWAVLF